jgi:hypothetical protein
MTSDPGKSWLQVEILTIASVCGVLFIAALTEVSLPLWSIPAMTLFAIAGLTLLCVLPFAAEPRRRFEDLTRPAS